MRVAQRFAPEIARYSARTQYPYKGTGVRAAARLNNEHLKRLYLSGLSMRQIGAKLGCSHFKIWWHLRKLNDHTKTVTEILTERVISAQRIYSVTRTHAHRRKLKHSLAMLRQKRPELYAAAVDSGRPKACPSCSRAIQAMLTRGLWAWQCSYCGAQDLKKAEPVAVLLSNITPKTPISGT